MQHFIPALLHMLYTVFIGVFVVLFIGYGIAAFYEAPEYPESSPTDLDEIRLEDSENRVEQRQQHRETRQQRREAHEEATASYNTTVSGIAIGAALLVLMISLFAARNIPVIADGLLFGGAFTLIYGVGRGIAVNDPQVSFTILAIALPIVLLVGYLRFYRMRNGREASKNDTQQQRQ